MKNFETVIQVRFNEVDAYNVAWHGHYVSWLEVGRNNLANQFGIDAFQLIEAGYLAPVVKLDLKYLKPARFNDTLTVRTTFIPSDSALLQFNSDIVDVDGVSLASGSTTHALTDMNGVLQFRLPPYVSERLDKMIEWLRCQ